jgi:predicted small lipoprotein YifL
MRRLLLCLAALLTLAACGTAEPTWAPDDAVASARYDHPGPKTITLFTVLATRNNAGAHAGLMINGSQRVMFDPAGTWRHPQLPERNDLHYGITPKMVDFYLDYHARETFYVVEQTIEVSPEVAELAISRVIAYGAVPKAQCTKSISAILGGLPGFESLPQTWFPKALMDAFGTLPGVKSRTITDSDANDNHGVLLIQAAAPQGQ